MLLNIMSCVYSHDNTINWTLRHATSNSQRIIEWKKENQWENERQRKWRITLYTLCLCVCINPFDHSTNNNPFGNETNERVESVWIESIGNWHKSFSMCKLANNQIIRSIFSHHLRIIRVDSVENCGISFDDYYYPHYDSLFISMRVVRMIHQLLTVIRKRTHTIFTRKSIRPYSIVSIQ